MGGREGERERESAADVKRLHKIREGEGGGRVCADGRMKRSGRRRGGRRLPYLCAGL